MHANRPHYGQQMVAGRLRALLDSSIHHSEIRGKYPGIQECALSRLHLSTNNLGFILRKNLIPPSPRPASHKNCHRVQDPYTLRCIPQVHGVVNDTLTFVRGILTTEMNSALDNPVWLMLGSQAVPIQCVWHVTYTCILSL